ncbi:hypothetical protein AIZ20_22165 [Salmonella enterica subsp. enterica serovar Typhimurium]|nr:hypothetical protein AIZ20_22165 [Salmonella enterica subsp. enterica serovar Typhimurium]
MRLVVTIQEILVTVSEKKKNLIIQVMLSELVIQGTKKNMLYQVQEATEENSEKIVHTMRQLSGPKPF